MPQENLQGPWGANPRQDTLGTPHTTPPSQDRASDLLVGLLGMAVICVYVILTL